MNRPASFGLRLPWLVLGLICTALGAIGVVVPGLPTTVFFICAAACFGRSSVRLERWVLELPGIGSAVRDYRDGLGMPRKAKVFAVVSIVVFSGLAEALFVKGVVARAAILVVASIGVVYVTWRVPTRSR